MQPFRSNSEDDLQVCSCGRTFDHPSAFAKHKRTCAKAKKRLTGALEAARGNWSGTSAKRRRIEETPFTPPLNFIHLDDDMQLQFIDDDIRDHTSLDAKVYAAFESNRDNAPPLAVTILLEVVSTVPDQLDQNYRDYIAAKQILEQYSRNPDEDENSNLNKLLGWCWREGTFSRIRRLSERSSMTLFF
jgi:hypothetical protein